MQNVNAKVDNDVSVMSERVMANFQMGLSATQNEMNDKLITTNKALRDPLDEFVERLNGKVNEIDVKINVMAGASGGQLGAHDLSLLARIEGEVGKCMEGLKQMQVVIEENKAASSQGFDRMMSANGQTERAIIDVSGRFENMQGNVDHVGTIAASAAEELANVIMRLNAGQYQFQQEQRFHQGQGQGPAPAPAPPPGMVDPMQGGDAWQGARLGGQPQQGGNAWLGGGPPMRPVVHADRKRRARTIFLRRKQYRWPCTSTTRRTRTRGCR